MLVKLFVSNIIIEFLYNLNKYIQYKHVLKLFEVECLHQHTVIALYRLDRNENAARNICVTYLKTGIDFSFFFFFFQFI